MKNDFRNTSFLFQKGSGCISAAFRSYEANKKTSRENKHYSTRFIKNLQASISEIRRVDPLK